jgi:uncharacterized membrane protein
MIKRLLQFLRTTLVGGILFMVPGIVLVIILEKSLALTHKFVDPLAEHIPVHSVIGLRTPLFLAIGLLLMICFFAGFFARTMLAQKIVRGLEGAVLANLPGYEFLKRMGESMLGVEREDAYPTVLLRFDDSWQIGFQIEALENGLVAVFIPGVPNASSGRAYLMSPDRVSPIGVQPARMLKCLKRLGVGSSALLRGLAMGTVTAKPTGNQSGSKEPNHQS